MLSHVPGCSNVAIVAHRRHCRRHCHRRHV